MPSRNGHYLRIFAIGPQSPSGRSPPKDDVSGEESASFILHGCRFGAPDRFRTCGCSFGGSGVADPCLRDIVNLMSRPRRKHWHSVRKGACVWIFRRCEGAAWQTLSPGDRADPELVSVGGLDWLGSNRRRAGCIHVHQTYAAHSAGRRSPAQGTSFSLPRQRSRAPQRRKSRVS